MTTLKTKKTCSILLSFVAGFAVMFSMVLTILFAQQKQQEQQLNSVYTFVRAIVVDANDALDELNALPYSACDAQTMIAMQRTLFNSHFLKEVGFLKNGQLICTTSGGILAHPVPEPAPTFLTTRKTKVIINHPLQLFEYGSEQGAAIIAELGQYNVVIHGGYLNLIDLPLHAFEIVFLDGDKAHHMYGHSGVFRHSETADSFSTFSYNHGLYSQHCDSDLGYCASATTPTIEIVKDSRFQLALTALLLIAAIWFVLKKTYPFEARISSMSYRIKSGIETGAFYPSFQPIVELEKGNIIGCEVLGRYQDQFGPLFPDQFIPLLKEQRLTWRYTIVQIERVCRALSELHLPEDFKVGFNIFPEDLTYRNINQLIAIAKPYLESFAINFEIVEDQVLDAFEAKEQIKKLANHGFLISIDDFGTGYSNLGQLESINCHYLKIDRQFIGDIEKGSLLSSLVPQISEIARRFKLECVAEGIENSLQRDLVLAQGIKYGQGWYFGKPMPLEQWKVFINAQEALDPAIEEATTVQNWNYTYDPQ